MNRIIIVSTSIPPTHSGAGLVALRYADRLQEKGNLSYLITNEKEELSDNQWVNYLGKKNSILPEKIFRVPLKSLAVNGSTVSKAIIYFYNIISMFFMVVSFMIKSRKNYDTVHCFSPTWLSFMVVISAKLLGKRIVLEITRLDGDDPGYIAKNDSLRILYQRRNIQYIFADAIVCLSPILYRRCIENGISEKKIYLIPRSVPENENKLEAEKKLLKPIDQNKELKMIFVGGIIERKGVHVIIEVLHKLNTQKNFNNFSLIIVGPEGDQQEDKLYKSMINQKIDEFNLSSKVKFTGFVENPDEYYKESDIFIFPSKSEGLPNVVLEAMKFGNIVIMNNIDGISDFIIEDEKNGFIIDGNDTEEYVKRISELLSNPEKGIEIKKNGHNTITKKFSRESIDKKYKELYRDIN